MAVQAVRQLQGTGSPQGVVSAPQGSSYYQTDAASGNEFWDKATGIGNTGWRQRPTPAAEAEVNICNAPQRAGHFQITGLSGLTANAPVVVVQGAGPYTGKGTLMDEAEMDAITVVGRVLNSTTVQCYWRCTTFVRGNFKFTYTARP